MRIAMLGWEFPPHIAGGLGVACEGIVRAVVARGHSVHFVVPALHGDERPGGFTLTDARRLSPAGGVDPGDLCTTRFAAHLLPYGGISAPGITGRLGDASDVRPSALSPKAHYGRDTLYEVKSFAERVAVGLAFDEFDVIHAHDWMTMPAGALLKQRSRKPLMVHVHSLEYDRAGEHGNAAIREIEAEGLHSADLVIAVSEYTKSVICSRYGIETGKVQVVHNGIYARPPATCQAHPLIGGRPVVLFLGRITQQKGPSYFVRAASIVRRVLPDTLFVIAGSGDLLAPTVNLVHELGMEKDVLFTGFLKGDDVERAYAASSLYVMPSVSEPFGLTALEAVRAGIPCILSRQSGVSEVIRSCLRVDFWDVERLADLIINALRSPELRRQLVEMSAEEMERMRWEASAELLESVYHRLAA